MFYGNTHDSKHNNIRIVSLAAGLALATAAVIGGSNLLKENSSSNSGSAVTPQVERTAPQFSTAADAVYASQGIRASSQFGTAADAVYAVESLTPQTSSAITDARDQALGLGQPSVGQSFSTSADAVYAAVGLAYVQPATVPNAAIDARDQALGIGQPSVGQSFSTAADAVYSAESLSVPTSGSAGVTDENFGGAYLPYMQGSLQEVAATTSTNLNNFLGLGQPGEGASSESPMFGSMADADYASR
jgi:hypothetical protein